MVELKDSNEIRTYSCPNCYLCGNEGKLLYQSLKDRLFGAPGEWNLKKCTNPECGLVWLDPMPLQEDIGKAYKAYYTHYESSSSPTLFKRLYWAIRDSYLQKKLGYTKGVGAYWYRYFYHFSFIANLHPGGLDALEASAMFLPQPKPGFKLLEIGCGNGDLLARMRDLGWEVQGIEFDSLAVQVARAKGIVVKLGDLRQQNYPDNYFNAIYMNHVIEHVYDPLSLLDNCRRILKKDGILVLLTPNTKSWGHLHFKEDWRGLEAPRHLYLFNYINIRQLILKLGFKQEEITTRTLARGAYYILPSSYLLRQKRINTYNSTLMIKIKSILYWLWERILILKNEYVGEEILCVISKKK